MSSIYERIKGLFTSDAVANLEQDRNEALVDSIIGAMIADGEIVPSEEQQIEEIVDRLHWAEDVWKDDYIEDAEARARDAQQRGDWTSFLEHIAERLDDDELRQRCYYLAGRIITSDKQIPLEETKYLSQMARTLDIPKNEQRRLIGKVRGRLSRRSP